MLSTSRFFRFDNDTEIEKYLDIKDTRKYLNITKTCPCNIQIFVVKIESFQLNIFGIFLIFGQNIDCAYMLEPAKAVLTS